ELRDVVEHHGIRKIYFRDATFTLDQKRTARLCALIRKAGWRLEWMCETRVDCLGDALLEEMAAAGCVGILIGVETGDEAVMHLKEGKKGLTVPKAAHLRRLAARRARATRGRIARGRAAAEAALRRAARLGLRAGRRSSAGAAEGARARGRGAAHRRDSHVQPARHPAEDPPRVLRPDRRARGVRGRRRRRRLDGRHARDARRAAYAVRAPRARRA